MTDGSVMWMQLSQATIAVGFAAHPALSAIMYRGLPREAYTQGAGLVASTGVLAEVVASLLGQLNAGRVALKDADDRVLAPPPPPAGGLGLMGAIAARLAERRGSIAMTPMDDSDSDSDGDWD